MNAQYETVRKQFLLLCMAGMLAGLFLPRAFGSISMIAFISAAFLHTKVKEQCRDFIRNPLLVGMSLLFLLPCLSGWWSSNRVEWQSMMQIKLPLLFLPLAFAGIKNISGKEWQRLALLLILFTLAGTVWSAFHYLQDRQQVDYQYFFSKTIRTPMEDDHVRFSWLVSFCVLLCGVLLVHTQKSRRWLKPVLTGMALWLIVYLHILSARTGLLSLYGMGFLFGLWLILYKARRVIGISILSVLILLPVAAYSFLPTFRNRVKYFRYELDFVRADHYRPGSNDGARLASLKAGWFILNQHPVAGAGFGDVLAETKQYYTVHYPSMPAEFQIYPSGEYMMYGAGTGWTGLLIYIAVLLLPFFTAGFRLHPEWWLLQTALLISLLPDNGLEVQTGVFLYAFVLLWCRDWWLKKAEC